MRYSISTGLLCVALAYSGFALASENAMNHAAMDGQQAIPVQAHKAHGVVNKIDLQNSKINLTHGPIKSLGWPGMTMDFTVKDATILKNIKVGQKVDFEVVKEGSGKFYISRITPLK
jgi:Cu/Ag efflux protein CusF